LKSVERMQSEVPCLYAARVLFVRKIALADRQRGITTTVQVKKIELIITRLAKGKFSWLGTKKVKIIRIPG
jgi:hypothetical protein